MDAITQLRQEKEKLTKRTGDIDREIAKLEQEPKQKAHLQISLHVKEAEEALEKATKLADEHGLYFSFDFCERSLDYSKNNGWSSSSDNC